MSIDQQIEQIFEPLSDIVASAVFFSFSIGQGLEIKFILVWLLAASLFFSFYLGFIQLRYFKHAIDLVRGKEDSKNNTANKKKNNKIVKAEGEITRFQALATSLSGTVGLGNIAGVAVAVSVGGPGAVLWMILMGFFSMATKFSEVMLGVKYRRFHTKEEKAKKAKLIQFGDSEEISGGPMYYLRDAFKNKNLPVLGTIFGGMFAFAAICGSVGGGNMFQANQAYQQLLNVSGGDASFMADKGWLFGLVLAVLVGLVILGGIKSIAAVASRLVPIMGALYLGAGLIVIALHFQNIPEGITAIIKDAFSMQAGIGGLLGGMLVGIQRAAFSNEAGLGSAAIVHSTARTNDAVSQGMVGMLGPFIDTVVICTITALVIVITNSYSLGSGIEGVELTSRAFEQGIPGSKYVLALTVLLFAFSTLITWSYYGLKGTCYLLGETQYVIIGFKLFFLFCIVVGSSVQLSSLINFSDAMILAMGFPNIIGLYLLAPEIKKDVALYREKLKT